MEGEPTIAISPARKSGLAVALVAGLIVIAGLLAWVISRGREDFQARARLSYKAAADLPTGKDGPVKAAARALDDAQLERVIAQYDLYPEARRKESSRELIARLRGSLRLTSSTGNDLVVAYRGESAQDAVDVTNKLSELLAGYSVTSRVKVPVVESPQVSEQETVQAPISLNVAPIVVNRGRTKSAAVNTAALQRQVARIDAALEQLANARATLAGQLQDVGGRLKAALSVKNVDSAKVAQLQAEEQGMVDDLGRTDAASAEESYKKAHIQEEIQKAGASTDDAATNAANATPAVVPQPPQPIAAPPSVTQNQAVGGAAFGAVRSNVEERDVAIQPFHLDQAATQATAVGIPKRYEWIALGIGTVMILVLFFVPLIPAEHVGEEIEYKDESVPEHVTYLGGERR